MNPVVENGMKSGVNKYILMKSNNITSVNTGSDMLF
jgi:hypothetical protein